MATLLTKILTIIGVFAVPQNNKVLIVHPNFHVNQKTSIPAGAKAAGCQALGGEPLGVWALGPPAATDSRGLQSGM